ncbi:hypothetical protein Tco_0386912 [Tanacetum coccineum]
MSRRSSSHADDSEKLSVFIVLYQISSRFAVRGAMLKDLICMRKVSSFLKLVSVQMDRDEGLHPLPLTMSGRSTRSNPANNTNPPNETTYEVARQLNTAMPNSLTQLVQALRCNRANQGDVTQSCSYKTFRSCGAKEFFGTEGAVGLLTWFENMKFVLHISKCPAESQVKFSSCML